MTKLEQLRQQVADMFQNAQEKEVIEKLATINTTIDAIQEEQDGMVAKNSDLIKSYKDLIQHTSFKDNKKPLDTTGGTIVSFEDALNNFMSNQK